MKFAVSTLLGLWISVSASAATVSWNGTADSDFANPANWSALPADDLVSDIANFAGAPGSNQPDLSSNRSIKGLLFDTPGGGWTLAGNGTLTLGNSGISAIGQSAGTTLLSTNLVLGVTQTWVTGSGGSVRVTGSLHAGESPAVTLPGQLIIGGTNAGDLALDPAVGRSVNLYSSLASAASVQVNERLLLGSAQGSTSSVNTIFNALSAGIRISNSGTLEVRAGEWRTNDLGSNNTGAFTGRLVISGGTLATGGARYLGQFNGAVGTNVSITAGSLLVTGGGNVLLNAGHLGLGAHGANTPSGTIIFAISGGLLDVAKGAGNFPAGSGIAAAALSLGGVANTTVLVNQSGGTVRVGLTSGSNVFTGATNANISTNLSIGSNLASNKAAYTLTDGTLIVAGTIQGLVSLGGVSNFNFLGGTLSAAAFNATNLGHSPSATAGENQTAESSQAGTLINRGGTLAPGGVGTAGRTLLTGAYHVISGDLAVDLGGATQATGFQSGTYDFLSVSGATTLGGHLTVNVLPGFTPTPAQTFTILTASGGLGGTFANAPHGARIVSSDGLHTFVVTQSANSLSLGNYAPLVAPAISSATAPEVIAPGDHVVVGVEANSLVPATYEWRRDGTLIAGANGSSLTLLNFQPADAGLYEVTVRNEAGAARRGFSVRVTVPPSSAQALVDSGTSGTFHAAPGSASYRWILDGEDAGTASTFVYSPIRRDVGTHWLRVVETEVDGSETTRHWTVRVRIPTPASTTFIHVAPTGSDTNDGSAGAPFLTLEKARDTIRGYSAGQRASGVTVYLRGGVHRRTTTFLLSAQDSGTGAAPIVYAAYPGETPILTTTRLLSSAQWSPLAASEHFRLAPGVDPARVWEASVEGNVRAAALPAIFNEWVMFNALRSSQNGGLFEVFANGERMRLSRYPNAHPDDDLLTPNLLMNGVAAGTAVDGSGYLNGAGTYTLGSGSTAAVGGAFHYHDADAARIARWESALSRGGLWLAGYWRVPWQLNGVRVSVMDPIKKVIGLATNPSNANTALVSNGIGDKYTRPAGSKKEPWWVLNLLEEIDVPGEWAIDFSRQRLYFLMDRDGTPADGEIELSDVGGALIQLNGASDIRLEKLSFQRHLGICVQVINGGSRNLVLGCRFVQSGNMAVDINGGTDNGVLSSDFERLGSGGVMLRGGSLSGDIPVPANHFAVNNRFRSFGDVVRVYQAAVDVGYGGPMGNWGLPTVGMRVAQNDIRTSPHAGILWNGHRHIIEYNEISDFTRISNDLGAIYRFGRNADFRTIIRYNHLFESPLGEGVYNDMDHVRTPVYGNTINLKTPASAGRGYGFWSNTHTTTGEANTSLPMGLQVYNNISVNGRAGFVFHSATGGRIENNVSYRPLTDHFRWSRITTNTSTNTHVVSASNAATLQSGPNIGYGTDPGFLDYSNDDLRLRPDAQVYRDMPDFDPVPLELAGNFHDENRISGVRVWTPFVATGIARSVAANSAAFTGELIYPQFDPNATVRLYWGTTDGGTDPAAWDHVVNLGQPGSGYLANTPANLAPSTRYFFRFHAENSAGQHWAEVSNSTTTFPLNVVDAPGLASSDTAGTEPDLAFDNNASTVWQTPPGTVAATLAFAFTGNAVRVTSYSVTSAPDNPARDPRDWRFEGSLDGSSWAVLDEQEGISFPGRGQTLSFGFVNPAAFRFYRLVITANAGDSSLLQLAGLRFSTPAITPDTNGPVITTPGDLMVSGNSSGAVVTFEVSAVDALSGTAKAVAAPASGSFFPVGNNTVIVTATDAAGNTSNATFTITVNPPSLPIPWTIQQIKPYSGVAPGTIAVLSSNSFRIVGAGGASTGGATADLWTGTNDSNTYVSMPWKGDGTFTARLTSLTSTDAAAKAGIIFRETTNAGSRYSAIYLIRNSGGAVLYQHKTATNGASTGTNFFHGSINNRGIPEWIRLVRTGDTFSLFYSENGTSWTQLSSRVNTMSGATLSVGFVVAPRTGGSTATAMFDNISFLTPSQIWRQTHFGTNANSGTAADHVDADSDGFANLLEYAMGTTPTSSLSRPTWDLSTAQIESNPGTFLEITFQRIADPMLTYTVEATGDLAPQSWTPIWQSTGAANANGSITVMDPLDIGSAIPPRRFLRLRVTSP